MVGEGGTTVVAAAATAALLLAPLLAVAGSALPRRILAADARAVASHLGQTLPPMPAWCSAFSPAERRASLRWLGLLAVLLPLLAVVGGGVRGLMLAVWVGTLLTLLRIDLQHRLLPDALTLPLLWLGLLMQIPAATRSVGIEASILGAVAGYLPFRLLGEVYRSLRGVEGMGQGDMKLLAAIGAWWGAHLVVPVYLLGTLLALLWRGTAVLRRRAELDEVFAFGPALVVAALVVVALGPLSGRWPAS